MVRYLFLGDCHGDLSFAANAVDFAYEHGVDEIIQVGDWGYLWPGANKLDRLTKILGHRGLTMRFIDGNHDEHPQLQAGVLKLWEPWIKYQPRGSVHTDSDGTVFLFMGGAPSIDRAWRTEGTSWWPEEVISDADYQRARGHGRADVIVTHDAPDYPPGYKPAGDPEFRVQSADSMAKVRGLIERYTPKLHVHGHWHYRYKRDVTVGLGYNGGPFNQSVMLWENPLTLDEG